MPRSLVDRHRSFREVAVYVHCRDDEVCTERWHVVRDLYLTTAPSGGVWSVTRHDRFISAEKTCRYPLLCVNRDSSVGIATRYGLDGP